MAEKVKLKWTPVKEASLIEADKKLLAKYRETQKAANAARDAFNTSFLAKVVKTGKVPTGKVPVAGHRFGKLSLAFADPKSAAAESEDGFDLNA